MKRLMCAGSGRPLPHRVVQPWRAARRQAPTGRAHRSSQSRAGKARSSTRFGIWGHLNWRRENCSSRSSASSIGVLPAHELEEW